jgi:TolB-like protein
MICGRSPADAHHLRFAQSRALGRKVSDEFTVPLCRGHHREVRHCGNEPAWWKKAGIDPTVSARALVEPSTTNRPSIAVLPFANMSGDPEQEYFADGISEEIITGLSKLCRLFVIARNSSFTYKGKAVDVKRVARELGVRYVLEGSVRKGGNRVRITAQLIDAATGNHIWADHYDGELSDVFALQDEITRKGVAAIEPSLLKAEGLRSQHRPPEDLDAWDMVMRANSQFWRLTTGHPVSANSGRCRGTGFCGQRLWHRSGAHHGLPSR